MSKPLFPNRSHYKTLDSIHHIWSSLKLPRVPLDLNLPNQDEIHIPSSFKIGHLAQASIALSAATAALYHQTTLSSKHKTHANKQTPPSSIIIPQITVPLTAALIEFRSERFMLIDDAPIKFTSTGKVPIGGLHRTKDGRYIRIHDGFVNHREAICELVLGDKHGWKDRGAEFKTRIQTDWEGEKLESRAIEHGAAATLLRNYGEWDAVGQMEFLDDAPIGLRQVHEGQVPVAERLLKGNRALEGVRVVELTRVIAAPVAGRTLAAHGADVLWVTCADLPDLPPLDRDTGRGKRSIHLNLNLESDRKKLGELVDNADVFIQSYRPGSLAAKGFGLEDVVKRSKRGIIYANLSAYGPKGPWSNRRGFDSLVQNCSGLNVSEAEHSGQDQVSQVCPCQVLDHASGFLLATGVSAGLYTRATDGGSYEVTVSLAGTMKYLRSLGQYEGTSGFQCEDLASPGLVDAVFLEERDSAYGKLTAPKHSANIQGLNVGFDTMPSILGSDDPEWLN